MPAVPDTDTELGNGSHRSEGRCCTSRFRPLDGARPGVERPAPRSAPAAATSRSLHSRSTDAIAATVPRPSARRVVHPGDRSAPTSARSRCCASSERNWPTCQATRQKLLDPKPFRHRRASQKVREVPDTCPRCETRVTPALTLDAHERRIVSIAHDEKNGERRPPQRQMGGPSTRRWRLAAGGSDVEHPSGVDDSRRRRDLVPTVAQRSHHRAAPARSGRSWRLARNRRTCRSTPRGSGLRRSASTRSFR
jgi:hypothetical protein